MLLKLPLSIQERTKLVCAILDANNAIALNDVIEITEQGLFVQGRPIPYEEAIQLRESARSAFNSYARKYVMEQVASIAGKRGIAEGDTPDKLIFYRAALWWGKQEELYYERLAQYGIGVEE